MSVEQIPTRSTIELLKDIEAIADRVDIKNPVLVKTKERPNSTKCKKTGAEHATKKMYMCSICSSAGHNSRSCLCK
ncbi:17195_t:CDS:2 [Cetraspora pellucida]|uniref:17195_t:CDS:1 n=1 Tax=Cetraspora pellucida TaxID=1433469 RepID=A0A9N9G8B7_9GLOM|nr:17195_t:CDS:2 [Cetraspora pellucida]